MIRRFFSFLLSAAATVSLVLFLAVAALWAASYHTAWQLHAMLLPGVPGDWQSQTIIELDSGGVGMRRLSNPARTQQDIDEWVRGMEGPYVELSDSPARAYPTSAGGDNRLGVYYERGTPSIASGALAIVDDRASESSTTTKLELIFPSRFRPRCSRCCRRGGRSRGAGSDGEPPAAARGGVRRAGTTCAPASPRVPNAAAPNTPTRPYTPPAGGVRHGSS